MLWIMVTVLMVFSFSSCKKQESAELNNPISEEQKVKEDNVVKEQKRMMISPYTGEEIEEDTYKNIPFMAVVENHRAARPQSGLSSADILFETLAEGGIPRFIALFHKNNADEIGPIRSIRAYFLDIAREYNLPFAHCGGSPDALETIRNKGLMSLNEFAYGPYYYRDRSRRAPHNLYTSSHRITKAIEKNDYIRQPQSGLEFDENFWKNETLTNANDIKIVFNGFYTTSYIFENGLYKKYMNGEIAIDKNNNNPLTAKNIIIQIAKLNYRNDEKGRIDIDLIGKGEGFLISNGKYIKIKWSRAGVKSNTKITDEKGNQVYFNVGNTHWCIVDHSAKIEIK
ncbi:hypothetical protein Q428_01580 [Fervidicella metallireducens AeB]|uniref:Lipoprotein YerB n=1 Tax=Fervidicella metallireducens AeB TaxID=1403537 RepID=A0A017RY61_9CLOT|nr:hypothetical protein Q428_01580 [Fervidicella metallireducens AeB]